MGHLLSSINEEAAAAMDAPIDRPNIPPVGATVIYVMRLGHGRNGKNRFPALVMGHGQRDTLELMVFIDAGDMVDETLVERAKPGQEHHCWEWPDDANAALQGMRGTLAALHQRVGEAEEENKRLREIVLGDFNEPKVSIIGIMQDFETRLRALKVEMLEKPLKSRGK